MDVNYDFHKLSPTRFEDLSATVISHRFQIPQMLTFADGRDGGRDAAARAATINLGGGRHLTAQNIVVQAKHTKNAGGRIDTESVLKNVFLNEEKKVKRLVKANHLDIYIVVTNYSFPAGQEEKLVTKFTAAGAKKVMVVGKETLERWIRESADLSQKVSRLYDIGGPSTHDLAEKTASELTAVKKLVEEVIDQNNHRRDDSNGSVNNIHKNVTRENRNHEKSQDSTIPSSILVKLSHQTGLMKNWKFVARRLKMEEYKIEHISDIHKGMTEQVYQMLTAWLEDHTCQDNTVVILSQALSESHLKGIAEYLENEVAGDKQLA